MHNSQTPLGLFLQQLHSLILLFSSFLLSSFLCNDFDPLLINSFLNETKLSIWLQNFTLNIHTYLPETGINKCLLEQQIVFSKSIHWVFTDVSSQFTTHFQIFNFTPHQLITRKCNRIRACIKRQINVYIILLVREKSFQMGLYALWVKEQKVNAEHIFNEESQQHLMPRNASPAASGLFCCIGC